MYPDAGQLSRVGQADLQKKKIIFGINELILQNIRKYVASYTYIISY